MKNFKKVLSLMLAAVMVIGTLVVVPMNAEAAGDYTEIDSVSEITEAGSYVIVATYTTNEDTFTYAMGTDLNTGSGYLYAVEVTIGAEGITSESVIPVWDITPGANGATLEATSGFLSATAAKTVGYSETGTETAQLWTLADGANGITIQSNAYEAATGGMMAFNYNSGNSPRYKTYANNYTQGVTEFTLYKFSGQREMTQKEIVEAAYELANGASLDGSQTLTGVVTEVNTEYSAQHGNVTVTIQVENLCEQPIMCYRLSGTGADAIGVGDEITVTGQIKNYNGTIEFVQGCTLDAYTTQEDLIAAGTTLAGKHALVGEIVAVNTAWSDQHGNITVTMQVGDTQLQAYRATLVDKTDEEAVAAIKELAIGDTVVVYGAFSTYNNNLQFGAGAFISILAKGNVPDTLPQTATQEEIIEAAYNAMETGVPMVGEYTLTGVIKKIDTPYASNYNNITVTIGFEGMEETIQCYRLTVADDASDEIKAAIAELAVGDTITVRGSFGSYNGTVQYNEGSLLLDVEKGELPDTLPQTATPEEIVNAAYEAMANNSAVIGTYTLTGKITSIDTEYAENYNNITVTMVVNNMTDKPIQCYRLTVADDASDELKAALAALAVDDVITVKGTFGYYNGKVQYNQGSLLTAVNAGDVQAPPTADSNMTGAYVVLGVSALALAVVEFKKRR